MWRGLPALSLGFFYVWTTGAVRAQDASAPKRTVCTWSRPGCSPPGPDCVCRLLIPNLRAAALLSQLDIDGDGLPDNAPDTDGDGLPDNWELGGVEPNPDFDRVVYFPAPTAIVPGTPPTPIFNRRAVATSAYTADTDEDGLSDFIEVFGLMFIDDNFNGSLDASEWQEGEGTANGLPNPGEYPIDNAPPPGTPSSLKDLLGNPLLHDFDGFIFTDPTNPDTDGDGIPDGLDVDPLINPRSFGLGGLIVRFQAEDNPDVDRDGLGNGMDMGNDLTTAEAPGLQQSQVIDNPANLRQVLKLFRPDLLANGVVPEAVIEDLLGADWDGNGLWRTTDVRDWSLLIDRADANVLPCKFSLLDPAYADVTVCREQTFDDLRSLFNASDFNRYGERGIGLGWQTVLLPSSTEQFPQFIPDLRVWAILYAWRMPGFDIDGDGFVGVPNISSTVATAVGETGEPVASVALCRRGTTGSFDLDDQVPLSGAVPPNVCQAVEPFDDRIAIGDAEIQTPELNGSIEVPQVARLFRKVGCGAAAMIPLLFLATALCLVKWARRRQ